MNITNITVTKTAEEKTENASYVLEYSIVNEELSRLHVSVNEKGSRYGREHTPRRDYLHGTGEHLL
ncbi:hypothetical protein NXY25_04690 [Bacteroides thetaiotaomicron]|nr:hypothetical protein [Bacteroides thetaiotaomicron]